MSQRLYTTEISSLFAADATFGNDTGLIVALPGRGMLPFLMIPEGYYALVTSTGREILHEGSCVWPPGFHSAGPFTKVSHLVTKNHIVFDAPVKGCKTSDNVTVVIDTSLVFRVMGDAKLGEKPELVRQFVHQVTPSGLEQQLKDALAEEIRALARSVKHTQIYACRTGDRAQQGVAVASTHAEEEEEDDELDHSAIKKGHASEKSRVIAHTARVAASDEGVAEAKSMDEEDEAAYEGAEVTATLIRRLNDQFMQQGVEIVDVMIQNVTLPTDIASQMSNKTLVRSKQEYEMMEQRFDMQDISLKNEVAQQKLKYAEMQEKMRAEGQKEIKAAHDMLQERQAVRERSLQEFLEQTSAEIDKIRAEAKEATLTLRFQKESLMQRMRLEGDEESSRITAESRAAVEKLQAETQLSVAQNEGFAVKALSDAEKASDAHLQTARKFQLQNQQLAVYEALATNQEIVLSNSDDKDFNMMLLADNVLKSHNGNKSHDALLADLNLLRLASTAYGLQPTSTYIPSGADNDLVTQTSGYRR